MRFCASSKFNLDACTALSARIKSNPFRVPVGFGLNLIILFAFYAASQADTASVAAYWTFA